MALSSSLCVCSERLVGSVGAHEGLRAKSSAAVRLPVARGSLSVSCSAQRPRPRSRLIAAGALAMPSQQVSHSASQDQLEVISSMSDFAATELMDLLKPVDKCWQPQDLLPDPQSPEFLDQIADLRKRTEGIPDDHLVTLVGDMITEEALPTYMTMLNTLDGVRDETGASATPWAQWTRKWTAEENRHGDLMNKYLWMTGRIDMKAVEVTIQNLIGSGMDPKTENNPYLGFIYTSFQERATKISHGNTARFAKEHGDEMLGKVCGLIAADEGRHEIAYQRIVSEILEKDPEGAVIAFADMMRKQIVMPAHLMDDNQHLAKTGRNLFDDFGSVAERCEVYTADDYADIMEHLIKRWNVESLQLSGEAQEAQDYVCKLPPRIRKLAARSKARRAKLSADSTAEFSWIFNREVSLM